MTRCVTSRFPCLKTTISPGLTSSAGWPWTDTMSPGQRVGSMLIPTTRKRSLPNEFSTSAANSQPTTCREAGGWGLGAGSSLHARLGTLVSWWCSPAPSPQPPVPALWAWLWTLVSGWLSPAPSSQPLVPSSVSNAACACVMVDFPQAFSGRQGGVLDPDFRGRFP
jgi:hypothetical protein